MRHRVTQIAAAILFALLLTGGFRPMLLHVLFSRKFLQQPSSEVAMDTRPLREKNDPTPPEMQAFLKRIRDETKPGESVGLVFQPPNESFSYAYWRANYILTGRVLRIPGDEGATVVAHWPEGRIERPK